MMQKVKCFINRKYLEDNRVMDALGTLLGVNMTPLLGTAPGNSELATPMDRSSAHKKDANKSQEKVKLVEQESNLLSTEVEMTETQVKVFMNICKHGVERLILLEFALSHRIQKEGFADVGMMFIPFTKKKHCEILLWLKGFILCV